MQFPTGIFWKGLFNYIIQKRILTSDASYESFYHTRLGRYTRDEIITTLSKEAVIGEMWVLKTGLLRGFTGGGNPSWEEFERGKDATELLATVKQFWKKVALRHEAGTSEYSY